jgi:hypothetical protein
VAFVSVSRSRAVGAAAGLAGGTSASARGDARRIRRSDGGVRWVRIVGHGDGARRGGGDRRRTRLRHLVALVGLGGLAVFAGVTVLGPVFVGSRSSGCSERPDRATARRAGPAGPRQRAAVPEAHRSDSGGADDRGRARRVHHDRRGIGEGIDRRDGHHRRARRRRRRVQQRRLRGTRPITRDPAAAPSPKSKRCRAWPCRRPRSTASRSR